MAGGTFTTQNKVRPGVYINFRSAKKPLGTLGERGVITMPLILTWGPEKEIIEINAGDDLFNLIGIAITEDSALLIRESLKRATKLLLYRVNTGTKAAVTIENLTVTAKYGGTKGNDVVIVIENNIIDETKFDVITLLDGKEVDAQVRVSTVEDLQSNSFVTFSGSGALPVTAGAPLTGGTNGSVTNQDYTDYLAAIEAYDFNTMALPSTDAALKAVFVAFIKRIREQEGKKVQCVLENYPLADYEGIISVKNGVILADTTIIPPEKAVAWVAGATAGAEVNESLTYTAYDDAVEVTVRYTNSQIEAALRNGEFLFVANDNRAVVEQDINTLVSFTPEKNKEFRKNRVIRVLDSIGNDMKAIFERYYIGKVNNNDDGRNIFKAEIISYMDTLQGIGAIQNFDPQTDIEVLPGNEIDAVVTNLYAQPVDAIEKIYMSVEVR
ncbi:phage tail sheath family protein [Geosporobacter ferrireducens]|uniref:phage tail sheath family protein n=1 Tax=Geosporobacter ferrireducens TaxID=1424294 RepID=UPI00139BBF99|nr:phage tail sheath family protein [Geosporobacter ferrireducens]MTI56156.1 phage tail sheath protein [Geosporobacter ferrireducens]